MLTVQLTCLSIPVFPFYTGSCFCFIFIPPFFIPIFIPTPFPPILPISILLLLFLHRISFISRRSAPTSFSILRARVMSKIPCAFVSLGVLAGFKSSCNARLSLSLFLFLLLSFSLSLSLAFFFRLAFVVAHARYVYECVSHVISGRTDRACPLTPGAACFVFCQRGVGS